MERPMKKLQLLPRQGHQEHDRPHAPSPIHPDDIPFNPEEQRKWEEQRGIHKKKPEPRRDGGVVDFDVDFNIFKEE